MYLIPFNSLFTKEHYFLIRCNIWEHIVKIILENVTWLDKKLIPWLPERKYLWRKGKQIKKKKLSHLVSRYPFPYDIEKGIE